MTKTTDKKKIKSSNPLPVILIAIGTFIVAISCSTDYDDVDYQQAKKEETRGLILGGTLIGAGFIGLKRQESR